MPQRIPSGKACSSCKRFYTNDEIDSSFDKDAASKDGIRYQCKLCLAYYREKRYQERLDQHREYNFQNRQLINSRAKEFYRKNKFKILIQHKSRKYRVISTLTTEQWQWILQEFEYRCFHCGQYPDKFHKDRVIPGVHGGGYTFMNIVPSCQPCNDSRGSKTVEEFRQYRINLGLVVAEWS